MADWFRIPSSLLEEVKLRRRTSRKILAKMQSSQLTFGPTSLEASQYAHTTV